MTPEILHLATTLGQLLLTRQATVTVAESCTGGGLGAAITAVPGSSQWFDTGFITYSNLAKQRWLNVDAELLDNYGAVSAEVVDAMAAGALNQTGASYAISISGIAGPDGGSPKKPVGSVWIGWASNSGHSAHQLYPFDGDRHAVRNQAVARALEGMIALVQGDLDQRV